MYSRPLAATGSCIAAALKLTSSGGRWQVGQFIKDAAHALSESLGVCSSGLCATETANLGALTFVPLGAPVLLQRLRLTTGELWGRPDRIPYAAIPEGGLASDVASVDVPNLPPSARLRRWRPPTDPLPTRPPSRS